jgi:acetyltransferase-like isoleucine patch superfamily enzyme
MQQLTIGHKTYGGTNVERRGVMNDVHIGKYCSIAIRCIIDGGFSHNTEFVSTYPFHSFHGIGEHVATCKGDVLIGNDVWIGEDVLIMSGVKIGSGAIIGARSIITKSVEPYSIVVGNNRVLRKRFTDNQINSLLKIKWWDWEDEKVLANAELLSSRNIDEFINKHI